jgi:hypothetical protein
MDSMLTALVALSARALLPYWLVRTPRQKTPMTDDGVPQAVEFGVVPTES